jgi:hypothetical protein
MVEDIKNLLDKRCTKHGRKEFASDGYVAQKERS